MTNCRGCQQTEARQRGDQIALIEDRPAQRAKPGGQERRTEIEAQQSERMTARSGGCKQPHRGDHDQAGSEAGQKRPLLAGDALARRKDAERAHPHRRKAGRIAVAHIARQRRARSDQPRQIEQAGCNLGRRSRRVARAVSARPKTNRFCAMMT